MFSFFRRAGPQPARVMKAVKRCVNSAGVHTRCVKTCVHTYMHARVWMHTYIQHVRVSVSAAIIFKVREKDREHAAAIARSERPMLVYKKTRTHTQTQRAHTRRTHTHTLEARTCTRVRVYARVYLYVCAGAYMHVCTYAGYIARACVLVCSSCLYVAYMHAFVHACMYPSSQAEPSGASK